MTDAPLPNEAAAETIDRVVAAYRRQIATLPGAQAEADLPAPLVGYRPLPHDKIAPLENKHLARFIDHTLLKPDTLSSDIERHCREAIELGCAAVCVNPCRVELCKTLLEGSAVQLSSVVGFPLGAGTLVAKAAEAVELSRLGLHEIDMVINVGWLKDGLDTSVIQDIRVIVECSAPTRVKVILETPLLTDEEKIRGCLLARAAGAHYVKTGTGLNGPATEADVWLLRRAVGDSMGVKAAGGIRDAPRARAMLAAGASRLGCSATSQIVRP